MCNVFNDKRSVRFQLFTAFGFAVVFSVALVLAVAIGLVASLGSTVKNEAKTALEIQSQTHANTTAVETAASIEQKLRLVADSIAMTLCKEATVAITSGSFPMRSFPTFMEYNMFTDCNPTNGTCPTDFGALSAPLSRLTGTDGSLDHSSLYVFNAISGCAIKDDSQLASTIAQDPVDLNTLINRLAHMDQTLAKMYAMATNTLQFYLSVRHPIGASYVSLHRTFPGVPKDLTGPRCLPVGVGQDAPYDAAQRPWFLNAPLDEIELEAYRETFSQELVINLSTKLSTGGIGADNVVAAALMLLSDLARIVSNVTVGVNGYAALTLADGHVLVYGQNSSLYLDSESRFVTINELDPGLVVNPGTIVQYLRPSDGQLYYVASESLFYDKLVLLVYARRADTFTTFPVLEDNVQSTSSRVTGVIVGICLGVIVLVLPAVLWITRRVSQPLVMINTVCAEVVLISAKEERDYRPALELLQPPNSNDEMADLVNNFHAVVRKLDAMEQNKMARPKYPANPLFASSQALGLEPQLMMQGLGEQDREKHVAKVRATSQAVDSSPPAGSPVMGGGDGTSRTHSHSNGGVEMTDFKLSSSAVPSPVKLNLKADTSSAVKVDAPNRSDGCCSLRTKLRFPIAGILLVGLLIAMAMSLYLLNSEGNGWMSTTSTLMTDEENQNLLRIASTKSQFASLFFEKATFDTSVLSLFVGNLLDGMFALDQYWTLGVGGGHLQSFSMDSDATDAGSGNEDYHSVEVNMAYSGYFIKTAKNCRTLGTCPQYAGLNDTTLSSLLDYKFKSLFHAHSDLDFIQIGLESSFTRIYPWSDHTTYATPNRCLYDASYCLPCPDPLPLYEPKCRSWYEVGMNCADPNKVCFQDPRRSSNGIEVSTSATPLKVGRSTSGALQGVLILNILSSTLTSSVNQVKVLSSGYVFLLSSDGTTVVLHPRVSASCTTVQCAEQFTNEELAQFQLTVVSKVAAGQEGQTIISKAGTAWSVAFAQVNADTQTYYLIVTVPLAEVLKPTTDAEDNIRRVIGQQLGIYIAIVCVLALLIFAFTFSLSNIVVQPIKSLIIICEKILQDDLSQNVTAKAGSLETKRMIEAFSGMVIALRFGSESYASGDSQRALTVFKDALELYTKLKNERGVGVSQNNLGSVYLRKGDLAEANKCYELAIAQTRQALASAPEGEAQNKALRVLSDRMGNLAVLRTEQKKFEESERLLNEALAMDLGAGNVRSMAIKQGSKGQLYLKMGQPQQAGLLFTSALSFIRAGRGVEKFDQNELDVAEQFALLNLGDHALETRRYGEAAIYLCQSLVLHPICDLGATARALRLLNNVYEKTADAPRKEVLRITLTQLSDRYGARFAPGGAGGVGKDVVFALDYSGSMAGGRITRAVQNMLKIFNEHVSPTDGVAFLRFNNRSELVFPMTLKQANTYAGQALAQSTSPNGGTAFRDAISDSVMQFQTTADPARKRWIVALTDGEDNSSRTTHEGLMALLSRIEVSLIVVGVGLSANLQPSIMELCQATQGGAFLDVASDSAEQLNAAFSKVADMIGAQQLQIETY